MRRPGRRRDRPAAAHPAQDPRFEDVLRDALQDAAKSVQPTGDGLERIRRRLREPWLARQVSLMLTADWLRLALAAAGAVIIAVTGAVAFGQIRHGDTGISAGTSAHAPTGLGVSSGSNGRFPALNAARATAAHTGSGRPIPSQPLLGGAHSAQVKPSLPAIAGAAPARDRQQASAAAAGCPPSPSGTPTGTPTPTTTPTPTVTPTVTPSPEPVGTPSPATSSSPSPSGARASTPRAPAVGRQSQPCDDGRGRQ